MLDPPPVYAVWPHKGKCTINLIADPGQGTSGSLWVSSELLIEYLLTMTAGVGTPVATASSTPTRRMSDGFRLDGSRGSASLQNNGGKFIKNQLSLMQRKQVDENNSNNEGSANDIHGELKRDISPAAQQNYDS